MYGISKAKLQPYTQIKMSPKHVTLIHQFVQNLFQSRLRKTDIRNLSGMIGSIITVHSPKISHVARSFSFTGRYDSARKRIVRFLKNPRWCISQLHILYVQWIASLIKKSKYQSIIIDYTFLGGYCILWAAIPFKKRSIPLYSRIIRNPQVIRRKQKEVLIHLEKDFLYFLRLHLPWDRRWIIVGDRQFGHSRNIGLCRSIGFEYLFRVKGEVYVSHNKNQHRIDHLAIKRWRRNVGYQGLSVNLLSIVEDAKDPWYLMTSLKNPTTTKRLYQERMWIEEMFRDMKTEQQLKKKQIRSLNMMKKLCFAVQLSYIIVLFIGLKAKRSKIIKKKLLGHTKASFVFLAVQTFKHFSQKFFQFLRKILRDLRLGRAIFDSS